MLEHKVNISTDVDNLVRQKIFLLCIRAFFIKLVRWKTIYQQTLGADSATCLSCLMS